MAKTKATPATVDGKPTFTKGEREQLLEYVLGHRKLAVQGFLEEHKLGKTGTKEDLRVRLQTGLKDGTVNAKELVELLDHIEGWGNQHVYLYASPPGEQKAWKVETTAKTRLKSAGAGDLFNQKRPLVLPDEATLSTVEWSPGHVRFVWVEKREWELRLDDEDVEENGILYKAYEPQVSRGITTFDWNLLTGDAALMIQRLPSGENYDEVRVVYETEIEKFIKLSDFTRVKSRRAIRNLEKSAEALNRRVEHETQAGGKASFTSKGRKTDAYADKDLKKSRDALGGQTVSVLGNFYFLPKAKKLDRNIHVKVYSKDQRVGIFGECTEDEVIYVLSRIRQHSK